MSDPLHPIAEIAQLHKDGLLGLEEWESEKKHWLKLFRLDTATPSAEQRRAALSLLKEYEETGVLTPEEAAQERVAVLKRWREAVSSASHPRLPPTGEGDPLETTAPYTAASWLEPPPPQEGEIVFRRYRLERKLQEQRRGTLWLARDQRLKETPFALHFLRGADLRDSKRRLQRMDASLFAQKLRHPGLVRFYDLLEDDERGWTALKLEYLEGQRLDALLSHAVKEKKRPLFPIETISAWLRQITDALDSVHAAGIVLRTFRPSSLVVTEEQRIKIDDVGLSEIFASLTGAGGWWEDDTPASPPPRQTDQPSLLFPRQTDQPSPLFSGQTDQPSPLFSRQTDQPSPLFPRQTDQPSPLFFKPAPSKAEDPPKPTLSPYLAPEVKAGKPLSPATDVFSLGIFVYYLLTGDLPKPTSRLLCLQVGGLPAAVDEVLRRAIAPRPRDRHLRARDLWTAWQEAFQPGPSAALPPEILTFVSRDPSERAWDILCQAAETLDLSALQLQTLRIALAAWPAEICHVPPSWASRWLQGSPPPALAICRFLQLQSQTLDPSAFVSLVSSPFFAYLSHLQLFDNPIGPEGAAALVQSPYLKDLISLDLSTAALGPQGASILAHAPTLAGLNRLYLFGNRLGSEGAAALALSPYLTSLHHLDLGGNDIGDLGVQALAASPWLARLTQLDLGANALSDAGAFALAASPYLTSLTSLDLWGHALSFKGQDALLSSPFLQKCRDAGGLHL